MSIARELEAIGIQLGSPNTKGVREGPCPNCGGKDRFAVWPNGGFKCNQCRIQGGLREFYEIVMGLSPEEAKIRAFKCAEEDEPEVAIDRDRNEIIDPEAWKRFARDEIDAGVELLSKSPNTLKWLREERGLNEETVRKMRLGLVGELSWMPRDRCGLRPYQKPDGKWVYSAPLQEGILIPHVVRGEGPVALQVRCWDATRGRYQSFAGSRLEATVVSFHPPSRTDVIVVVESVLDAALIHQETAIPVVALGGTNAPLGRTALEAIETAALVVVLMDNDAAGHRAAKQFELTFPNAVPCYVPEDPNGDGPKDITDAWRNASLKVKPFITAAIRHAARELKRRNSCEAHPCIVTPSSPHETAEPRHAPGTSPAAAPVASRKGAFLHITDPSRAKAEVHRIAEENDILGIAITTAPLPEHTAHPKADDDPHLSQVRLLQISGRSGDALLIDVPACADELGQALAPLFARRLVAHDGVRIMRHLMHMGLPVGTTECTMLMWNAQTNDTKNEKDPAKGLSLESVLRRSIGIEISGGTRGFDWNRRDLPEEQLARAAESVLHLVRLAEWLLERLGTKKLEPVYLRMRDAQRAVARMELQGIGFDAARHAGLIAKWRAEAAPLERRVRAIMGTAINLGSDKQKSEWLRGALPPERIEAWPKTPTGLLSTAAEALEENRDLEVATLLQRLGKLRDLLSDQGDGLAAFVSPVTGRVHASFHLTGAVTGRMSSEKPNLHSIPHDGGVRELFSVGGGRLLVSADFSQIDLRVAALLSGDRAMLDAYRNGEDLHRLTASRALGISPERVTAEQRQMAKALNFGTLYGQGGAGLRSYAKAQYGVELSVEDATAFQERLFEAYPQLGKWREARRRGARSLAPVRTKGGRMRTFSEGEDGVFTKSLNTPIQGTAGEIMLRALTLVDERLDGTGAFVVNTVHDDILVECPKAEADCVEGVLRESMTQAMLEMFPEAPMAKLVECGRGKNWAKAK